MAFSTLFSRFLFLSAFLLSLPRLPLFPSCFSLFFFPNVAHALAVAPALCAPARVARAMASDFHANLNVAAVVVSGTLTACGSTPLAVWGALPKRRGNAGSDSDLPYHLNTFLEARWDCVFASALALALALALTLTLTLTHSLSLCNLSDCPSARAHAHFLPSHLSHALSNSSPSSSSLSSSSLSAPLSLIFFLCVLFFSSSSSLPLLLLGVFLVTSSFLLFPL